MGQFKLHPQLAQDCEAVLDWPLCKLLLMNNAQVLWLILVPRVEGVEELHDLTRGQQHQLWQEVEMLGSYLSQTYAPHKLNLAAIGNKVRQLHMHLVVRQEDDACWPEPVWGNLTPSPYNEAEKMALVSRLRADLH
ncbi:MAG: HIT domain-containing protein [Gammaproteobacteria bacterium]|jgi:diadenosine tetraphosphate (Ap4A) HIT family hydrolase|nr:HIT domain-containing protein [Gammaproteobacteria bacterium]